MKVTTITFTLDRSIPVMALSGREADRYASIRPAASVTIEGVDAPVSADGLDSIREAFDFAADRCFEQLKEVGDALRELYRPKPKPPPDQ